MTGEDKKAIHQRAKAMDNEEIKEHLTTWDIAYIFNDLEERCRKADALKEELKALAIKYLDLVEREED